MKNRKFRHELKYLCSDEQVEILKLRISTVMERDKHVNESGKYHIRSIYFDDIHNTSFFENEDGISPREKWRIRIYNNNRDRISLECKRKESTMISKRTCLLTDNEYNDLLVNNNFQMNSEKRLLALFSIIQMERIMQPKVIIGYDRIPYICHNGNVRITIDQNIYSSPDISRFFNDNISKRMILPIGMNLLEVKYDEYLPSYIKNVLQIDYLEQITFSKYFLGRKYSLGL